MDINQAIKEAANVFITEQSGETKVALNDAVVEALKLYVTEKGGTPASSSINDLVNQATAYYFTEQSVSLAPRGNDAIFEATGRYLTAKSEYVPVSFNERVSASASYFIANGGGPSYTNVLSMDFLAGETPEAPGVGSPGTVTRALAAYSYNLAGLLNSTTTGVSRVTDKGLLVEGSKRNFLLNSETFQILSGVTITATNVTGPDGQNTASTFQQTTANSVHHAYRGTFAGLALANQVVSVYMKKDTWRYGYIDNVSQGGGGSYMVVDLDTGDFVASGRSGASHSNIVGYVETCANGWYRCSLSSTGTSGTVSSVQIGMAPSMAGTWQQAFVGSTSNRIHVAKTTLTNGIIPTSPIDCTGTSITRPEDSITFAQTVPTGVFEFLVGFTTTWGFTPTSNRTLFHWHDGTDANSVRLELNTSNRLVLTVRNSSVDTVIATEGGTQPLRRSGTAKVVRNDGDWGLYVDDVWINTTAVTTPTLTTLRLGATRSSTLPYDDYLTSLTIRQGGSALPSNVWSFNGTAGSGFSVTPTDVTRTTAKPGGHFVNAPLQVMTVGDTMKIEVLADAKGGVAYVDFLMEGITTRQAVPTVKTLPDVNGVNRTRTTYSIDVTYATLIAQNAAGGAFHCYARVTALDGTMQTRLIGPLKTYFRPTIHDWIKTVSPTGLAQDGITATDYTTLQAAEDAAITANALCPKIILAKTDNYNIVRTSYASASRPESNGRPVLTHAAGVTATLYHPAVDLVTVLNNQYWCRLEELELRGSGIVWDTRNLFNIVFKTGSGFWANGIKITSTATDGRDTLEYNLAPPPQERGFAGNTGITMNRYFSDVTAEYGSSPYGYAKVVIHCHNRKLVGDVYSHTEFVAWNQDEGLSAAPYRVTTDPFINITAYPVGGSIEKTGSNGNGTLIFRDGAGSLTINLVDTPEEVIADGTGNSVLTTAELVAKVNARAGWTLNITACLTTRAARFVLGTGIPGSTVNSWPEYTLTGALTLYSLIDVHMDYYQTYGILHENVLVHYNQVKTGDGDTDLSAFMFMDSVLGHKDFFIRGNVFPTGSPGNAAIGSRTTDSHVVVEENTLGIFGIWDVSTDAYNSCQNNYIDTFARYGAAWGSMDIKNNAYRTVTSTPDGANCAGNFATGSTYALTFQNQTTDDYRPTAILTSTLKAKRSDYDIISTARSATDAVGAYSKNAAARTFWTF